MEFEAEAEAFEVFASLVIFLSAMAAIIGL
jgi:hypothetical protein